jgi:hypothetical protein
MVGLHLEDDPLVARVEEKSQLFPTDAVAFNFNAKNPIYANKTMVIFQHLALHNRHHHWQTLSPLPYNLNLHAIKPNKIEFRWTYDEWGFFLKNL